METTWVGYGNKTRGTAAAIHCVPLAEDKAKGTTPTAGAHLSLQNLTSAAWCAGIAVPCAPPLCSSRGRGCTCLCPFRPAVAAAAAAAAAVGSWALSARKGSSVGSVHAPALQPACLCTGPPSE